MSLPLLLAAERGMQALSWRAAAALGHPSRSGLRPRPLAAASPPPRPLPPAQVEEHEKYFVYEARPGSLEWRILGEACSELDKLEALVDGKIKVGWGGLGGREGLSGRA